MTTHIGVDFVPPDIAGKVTGEIKYAEDYKREGMVFARLLTSPLPSGRVVNIDASEALRMDGVIGILTADDLPPVAPPGNPALASQYVTYVGQPILAVAAITEEIAESAIDRIRIDFERRDFVVDPLKAGGFEITQVQLIVIIFTPGTISQVCQAEVFWAGGVIELPAGS